MPRTKVFISYSHAEKTNLEELLPVLESVPNIESHLWYDEWGIDIGDKFDPEIQRALNESGIGILLLSPRFFTSKYIQTNELPYLVEHAENNDIKIASLYVTSIPDEAFKVAIEVNGHSRSVDLRDYLGAHNPTEPLDRVDGGRRNAIYTKLTNWVARQLRFPAPAPGQPPSGHRYELAVDLRLRDESDVWEHTFSAPRAANFARPNLNWPTPKSLF